MNTKNLKPFDLELAKSGHPVCTRDGHKARILAYDVKNAEPLIVAVEIYDGTEQVYTYKLNGKFIDDNDSYEDDLIMAPVKHEGWVNIYKCVDNSVFVGNIIFQTYDEAKNTLETEGKVTYVATVKIEWEE